MGGGGVGEKDEKKHQKKYQLAPTDLFVLILIGRKSGESAYLSVRNSI